VIPPAVHNISGTFGKYPLIINFQKIYNPSRYDQYNDDGDDDDDDDDDGC